TLRWTWSPREVGAPRELVLRRRLVAPLPGCPEPDAAALRGGTHHDLYAVYGGLRSGRVAVLGEPGGGKSSVAVLTVLRALEERERLPDAERHRVPVPVLLGAGSWDPERQPLTDWLAGQLHCRYPLLRLPEYGQGAAGQLVRERRVALFLESFDEMDARLWAEAFRQLDAARLRIVLFARSAEYVRAAPHGAPTGPAALELLPLTGRDAADFLTLRLQPLAAPWQPLVRHLRQERGDAVTEALARPLTLRLLVDVYRKDPAGLAHWLDRRLAVGARGTPAEIEAELMDRLLQVAYRPGGSRGWDVPAERAREWLRYVARGMHAHGDLDWRRMPEVERAVPRVLAFGAVGVAAGALVGAVVFSPLGQQRVLGRGGVAVGALWIGLLGLVYGLVTGAIAERRGRHPPRVGAPVLPAWRRSINPATAALVALIVGSQCAVEARAQGLGPVGYPFFLLAAALGSGVTAGLAATAGRTAWGSGAGRRVRAVRGAFPASAVLAAGLPIGTAHWLSGGAAAGLLAGVLGAVSVGLMVGASRPVVGVGARTHPHGSWREDRRRALVFGVLFGIGPGVALGLQNGLAGTPRHGVVAGLVTGVCTALLIGLAGSAAAHDFWRTTALFVQLRCRGRFPARGMAFLHDAYARGVLRADGPRYQFRHALLRERLRQADRRGG
ncbi:hypothetical protein AAHZ94_17140, partial [Streptomyces sp. HSW2009]|uniref:hypothetical protein n=1 Tax=Streptomyces sp. HSW2009 TaxID=3142890 RepID=UPI0032EB8831